MIQDRSHRCILVAALILGAALSLRDVQAPASRGKPSISASANVVTLAGSLAPVSDAMVQTPAATKAIRVHAEAKPFEGFALSMALRDSIVAIALSQLGAPYILGGTTPEGFDCSGLIRYAVSQVHMTIPRLAMQQARVGASISRSQLQRGDFIAFGDDERVTHIGIYVGSGWFVHASSVAGRVVLSPLDRRPSRLIRPMRDARRLLAISEGVEGRSGG